MKLHETWLIKARNDLLSSKILCNAQEPVLDTSIYHTQQCAEKSLKSYLAFKSHPIEKTHDIEYLVQVCSEFDPEFNHFLDDAEKLNPYSIFFRYPNVDLVPEEQQVHEAIGIAEKLLQFVEQKIKADQ